LKAAQKDLLEAKDLNELKAVFKKWRRIGLEERLQALAGRKDSGTIERGRGTSEFCSDTDAHTDTMFR